MSSRINILVSTINKGICHLDQLFLKQREDVSYIVSHQYTDEQYLTTPDFLMREDVLVSHIPGSGVTKSRNNAIKLATAEISVIADDDVRYKDEWIDMLKNTFNADPELDMAIFKIKTLDGEPDYRAYPSAPAEFKELSSVCSIEIAFRTARLKELNLNFDERFGVGSKLLIGSEERIFMHDCVKAGLKIKYFPEYLVQHPYLSTVKAIPKYDSRLNRITGAIDARINGWVALPKSIFGTFKNATDIIAHKKNPLNYFFHRFYAALYILITK